ncbi:branched-chain alpha-keto acid dehydrogenase subunit E2 [compost metagenome]
MSVQVIDVKTGKIKTMPKKYADLLVRMKRARWPDQDPPAVPMQPSASLPVPTEAPKASKAARALAESAGIDLSKVTGTGNDGAITKPDVEAFIAAHTQE